MDEATNKNGTLAYLKTRILSGNATESELAAYFSWFCKNYPTSGFDEDGTWYDRNLINKMLQLSVSRDNYNWLEQLE